MKPIQLRCNFMENQIGIDDPQPRFSWQFTSREDYCWGEKQTAFQIQMAECETGLQKEHLLWDSEKIETDQSTHILYKGSDLKSRQRIYWRVKIWDQSGTETEMYSMLARTHGETSLYRY